MKTLRMIGSSSVHNGLFYLNKDNFGEEKVAVNNICSFPAAGLWHYKLGHLSNDKLELLKRQYSYVDCNKCGLCDVCHLAKQKHLSFPVSKSITHNSFNLIHFDIWGPFSIVGVHGHRYFFTVLDDCTHFLWVVLLKHKSEVRMHVQNFIQMVEV